MSRADSLGSFAENVTNDKSGNQTGTHNGYYYHRFTQSGTFTYTG